MNGQCIKNQLCLFSVRVAETEQGGDWVKGSLASKDQRVIAGMESLGRGQPAERFACTVRSPGTYSAMLLRGNSCRSPSIWQQGRLRHSPALSSWHTLLDSSCVHNRTPVFLAGCLPPRIGRTDVRWSRIRFNGSEPRVVGSSRGLFPV